MEDLSDYTSPVIEFKATHIAEKQLKLTDNSTATDPLPVKLDVALETNRKCHQETQTEIKNEIAKDVDERKLSLWLRKILPSVEKELLKGCTPLINTGGYSSTTNMGPEIQLYQKLTLQCVENSQGLAIWLSVQTNNAPALVISTVAPHDDWCEHIDQYLLLYAPRREHSGNFLTYSEIKRVRIKACLKSLCTNPFNKNMFAGSTLDGDLYIWLYEQNVNKSVDVKELFNATSIHGYAVAMDWSSEQTLLTAHSNGHVLQWSLGKELIKEAEFFVTHATSKTSSVEICCLLAVSLHDFVVGCKDGSIYHCWISTGMTVKRHLDIVNLKKHLFMTSSLLKTFINGHTVVISCDLSGEVYFHDMRNSSEDTADTVNAQIPLPFTNVIACTQDGNLLYSPGDDGTLECYRVSDGIHFAIKGSILRGKGNFIKASDNGCWIITGLYENEFQIFSVEN